jgi:hypothetical protein
MILSHKHKFIFVKGKKVGGTSAEIALSQVCGPDDIISPITPQDERHRVGTAGEPRNYLTPLLPKLLRQAVERQYVRSIPGGLKNPFDRIHARFHRFWNHMDLAQVLRFVPEAENYRILGVERSPYAKVLSLANWDANRARYAKGGALPQDPWAIADAVDRLIASGKILEIRNIEQYRDRSGAVRAVPWKTDTLADDVEGFVKSLGFKPIQVVHAKRGFDSDKVDLTAMLKPEQIEAINRIFEAEFAIFDWPMIG